MCFFAFTFLLAISLFGAPLWKMCSFFSARQSIQPQASSVQSQLSLQHRLHRQPWPAHFRPTCQQSFAFFFFGSKYKSSHSHSVAVCSFRPIYFAVLLLNLPRVCVCYSISMWNASMLMCVTCECVWIAASIWRTILDAASKMTVLKVCFAVLRCLIAAWLVAIMIVFRKHIFTIIFCFHLWLLLLVLHCNKCIIGRLSVFISPPPPQTNLH